MPALSPTMKSGKIAKWIIKEGSPVNIGDVLVEIETDKAIMEFESADEGILGKILVPEGSEVIVGEQIGWLLESLDEAIPETVQAQPSAVAQDLTENPVRQEVQEMPMTSPQKQPDKPETSATSMPTASRNSNLYATPAARARASALGIDLESLKLGRQIKDRDVLNFAQTKHHSIADPLAPTKSPEHATREPTQMQKTIAQRMTESKQQVPHFYIETEVNIDKLISLKEDLQLKVKTTFTHWFILAAARAIRQNPLLKNSWINNRIHQAESIDVSIAVDLSDGLITPVVRNADMLSLPDLVRIATSLIEKARDRKLKPSEYQGGVLTISNMGSWGIIRVFPIINQPQSSIVGIGCSREKVMVADGIVKSSKIVSITLAGDHRILNGSDGASFLRTFKTLIENPAVLLV